MVRKATVLVSWEPHTYTLNQLPNARKTNVTVGSNSADALAHV